LKIRSFHPSDLEAVLQLFHDVIHSVGRKYYTDEQVNAWAPKEGVDRGKWLKSLSENITYIVEADGKIVAFADMTHSGYIDHMFIDQKYQGQGISFTLGRKFEEEARKLGLKELTTEASITAKPVAERMGFTVVQKQSKVLRGVAFTNYLMSKKL
jgi:putative acetyltransferase